MSNKYIFIDDQDIEKTEPITNRLSSFGNIIIEPVKVMHFQDIVDYISKNIENIDGIILDLRLDEIAVSGSNNTVKYKAPALAQELRTLSAETVQGQRRLKDLPIVLCSTDENIKAIYRNENTGHNLFDIRFLKTDTDNFHQISKQLLCLLKGYELINQDSKNVTNILNINEEKLDDFLLNRFRDKEVIHTHEIAQLVLKDLIFSSGTLIDKNMLIAKLGIDKDRSSNWEELISAVFHKAKYNGVFSEAWDRWWMHEVNQIFTELTGKYLAQLNADERIAELIANTTFKGLIAAEPLKGGSYSNRFWTYCKGFKAENDEIKLLDPLEGFKIARDRTLQPWQEYEYISFEALLNRYGKTKGIKIHSSEKERFELKKAIFLREHE